ncbi:hypothetical protein F8M41_002817 [Gigaspora margarita]|uniref:Uncharacterized protein n=1 Tax=Gigaspora margarita TaxID=4874 RepID=A0A8H4AYM9_GIGMA|nr:hypothetical protein F8M41_002817 [Gigaspora margarita]
MTRVNVRFQAIQTPDMFSEQQNKTKRQNLNPIPSDRLGKFSIYETVNEPKIDALVQVPEQNHTADNNRINAKDTSNLSEHINLNDFDSSTPYESTIEQNDVLEPFLNNFGYLTDINFYYQNGTSQTNQQDFHQDNFKLTQESNLTSGILNPNDQFNGIDLIGKNFI